MIKPTILAVGRLKSGPEKALVDDYLVRAGKTGRALGIAPPEITEVEDRTASGKGAEARLLTAAIPANAKVIALDERGQALTSPELAAKIADWRDDGTRDVVFLIGGADGLDRGLTDRADLALSFGKLVWPHMLARVMLAEQIYRATTILARTPYHRA